MKHGEVMKFKDIVWRSWGRVIRHLKSTEFKVTARQPSRNYSGQGGGGSFTGVTKV